MDDDGIENLFNRYEGVCIELGKTVERIERERRHFAEREEYLLEQLRQAREAT